MAGGSRPAHDLWLRLTEQFGSRLHHRDVVGVALRRLEKDLGTDRKDEVLTTWNANFASNAIAGRRV